MQRPDVRIVQQQSEEETISNIDQSEINDMLLKYGYSTKYQPDVVSDDNGLTFDQMIERQQKIDLDEKNKRIQLSRGSRPITFDGMEYSETKYASLEEDPSIGFSINIVSDMKLPNRY